MRYEDFTGLSMWAYRGQRHRPLYTTIGQLYVWAQSITAATQEGETYHDALSIWQGMIAELTSLFDGSQTYTNPLTGETINILAVVEDADDMQEYIFVDYNIRQVWWPVFDRSTPYSDSADIQNQQMYAVLKHFCNRVHRFYTSKGWSVYKTLGILAVEYNPIADYWSKANEVGGSAPYASINAAVGNGDPSIGSWTTSNNGKDDYKTENEADGTSKPTVKNYTSTYDDSSEGRLAGYSEQSGKTTSKSELPNSAYFKNFKEEGNRGQSPQEMIQKELELNSKIGDVLRNFLDSLMNEVCLSVVYED